MNPSLKLAIAQINTCVGDFKGNAALVVQAIRRAKAAHADLVVFPEMTLPGYPPEDLLLNSAFIQSNDRALRSVARQCAGIKAVVGFVDRDRSGKLYNAAALIGEGGIELVYRKHELPNYGVFDEKRYFAHGLDALTFVLKGRTIALTICEDIWIPDNFTRKAPYRQVGNVILNLSASPYYQGKQSKRYEVAGRLAEDTGAFVVYANLVGGQDELVFDGGSFVMSPDGTVLAEAKYLDEDFLFYELTWNKPAPKPKPKKMSVDEETYQALVLGTRDYIRKNGFKKVVLGLSGGIDSALVACIAADAIGPGNVLGVTMPSEFTSKGTYQDAVIVAKNLGIKLSEIPIRSLQHEALRSLKPFFSGTSVGVAEENLQARLRGLFLMALSNKFGHLVLTTGNKSEFATGYCTLYGDMAGGFAVIKDVPKTLVYRLSRYRNRRGPGRGIPGSVIRRAPSAELRPHQKDQDSLPPYAQLDRALHAYVEKGHSLSEMLAEGIPAKLARHVVSLVDANEYKRRQSPPGVKITPLAFGRDRRMPITHRFRQ